MDSFIHWLEIYMFSCPYKGLTGFDCPGCGMQRSFIELLKGNFIESVYLYPALLFVMGTLLFTVAHLYFKFRNGANIIKYSFIITTGIIISNYFYKMYL